MRFGLSKLLFAIALVALGCACMAQRSRWWADGILTLTFLLYVVVAIRAVGLKARDRASAIAFAAVGAAYFFFVTCCADRNKLLTNIPLAALATWLNVLNSLRVTDGGINWQTIEITIGNAFGNQFPQNWMGSNTELYSFFLIGYCVWSWLFATLSGWFVGIIYGDREFQQRV